MVDWKDLKAKVNYKELQNDLREYKTISIENVPANSEEKITEVKKGSSLMTSKALGADNAFHEEPSEENKVSQPIKVEYEELI